MMYIVDTCTTLTLKGLRSISKNLLLHVSPSIYSFLMKASKWGAPDTNPLWVFYSDLKTGCPVDVLRIL